MEEINTWMNFKKAVTRFVAQGGYKRQHAPRTAMVDTFSPARTRSESRSAPIAGNSIFIGTDVFAGMVGTHDVIVLPFSCDLAWPD